MKSMSFEESVRQRAFEIFNERGNTHGNDRDDWFRAEREVRSGSNSSNSEIQSSGKFAHKRKK